MQHLENVRGDSVIITPVIDTNVIQIVNFGLDLLTQKG